MQQASPGFVSNSTAAPDAAHQDSGFVLITRQRESFENANNVVFVESHKDVDHSQASHWFPIAEQHLTYRWSAPHSMVDLFGANVRQPSKGTVRSRGDILSLTYFSTPFAESGREGWLEDSFGDLSVCTHHAIEEGLEEPSGLGLAKARVLLEEIASHIEDQPEIYPMDEGSIAIDFRNPECKSGVLFLIEKGGSGALFYRNQKSKGQVRVDDATDLLSEGGLLEMKRVGIR